MVSEKAVKLGRKKQGRQPERVLRLNEDTGLVELAGSKKEVDTALKGEEILAFLEEQEEPVQMVTIQAELKCRRKPLNDAFRALVERGKIERSGSEKGVTCTTILLFPRVPKKRRFRQHAGNSNCSVIPKD